jgi:hypothetical protein
MPKKSGMNLFYKCSFSGDLGGLGIGAARRAEAAPAAAV